MYLNEEHIRNQTLIHVWQVYQVRFILGNPCVGVYVERLNQMSKPCCVLKNAEFYISTSIPQVFAFIIFTVVSQSYIGKQWERTINISKILEAYI